MAFSHLSHLECPECGLLYACDELQGLCVCGSPLLARYDMEAAARAVTRGDVAGRSPTLWRYHEILPVRSPDNIATLGEGMTPLLALPRLGGRLGVPRLLVKDESALPTGTFKARGAAVGVSRARELGVKAVALPTNGNAGAAWSAFAARAGIDSLVVMPTDAPAITAAECAATGSDLYLVRGLIGDAGAIVADSVARSAGSVMDAATLKEPYRVEGKKTMGLEIVEQLGWRVPDVIVYPAGGGVGLIGIHKALVELRQLGWIGAAMPRLVVVQSTGCAPIVQAFERGERSTAAWPDASTIAFGITVPNPLGGRLVLDALYETSGTAIAVDDAEILAAQAECARSEGLLMCPEGAATLAAVSRLRESGWIGERDEVVAVNTGAGILYPETFPAVPPVLDVGGQVPASAEAVRSAVEGPKP